MGNIKCVYNDENQIEINSSRITFIDTSSESNDSLESIGNLCIICNSITQICIKSNCLNYTNYCNNHNILELCNACDHK